MAAGGGGVGGGDGGDDGGEVWERKIVYSGS